MADSTTFAFAIFRLTNVGDTEANIANQEAVGMTVGVDDDFDAGLIDFHVVSDARRTDVGSPDNTTPSSPDTGNVPTAYELEFVIDERLIDSVMIPRLQKFLFGDKVTDDFSKGRFGLRYDAKSYININPLGTGNAWGGKLIHFDWDDDIQWGGLVHCKATILFTGNPAAIITQLEAAD